jgi:anti-anti-sigma factor
MSAQTKAASATSLMPRKRTVVYELPSEESAGPGFPSRLTDKYPGFRVWKRIDGSVDVSGEVDFGNAESFRATLCSVVTSPGITLISLRGLEFIDSAGIRAIVSAARSFPNVEFRLTSAKSIMVKCWELLRCDALVSNVRFFADIRGETGVV